MGGRKDPWGGERDGAQRGRGGAGAPLRAHSTRLRRFRFVPGPCCAAVSLCEERARGGYVCVRGCVCVCVCVDVCGEGVSVRIDGSNKETGQRESAPNKNKRV